MIKSLTKVKDVENDAEDIYEFNTQMKKNLPSKTFYIFVSKLKKYNAKTFTLNAE